MSVYSVQVIVFSGHVDPGEDEWIAALRETKEEAGIDSKELDIHKDCHETLRYTVIV